MSARDWLFSSLVGAYVDPSRASAELDAHAAEVLAAAPTGGRLRDFTPVWTTSDGSDVTVTELRCVLCGQLVQGVGPHTLLDLTALAAAHDCQNDRKDGRS